MKVFRFRSSEFLPSGDVAVSIASAEFVTSVFGGIGVEGADGLTRAFGGGALFPNDVTGERYLGVWGTRKASRFRRLLRASAGNLKLVDERPPVRLVRFNRTETKPRSNARLARRRTEHSATRKSVERLARLRDVGWKHWDPIQLRDAGGPEDEYDEYLLQVVSRLERSSSEAACIAYLMHVESEDMMIARDDAERRAAKTVAMIHGLLNGASDT